MEANSSATGARVGRRLVIAAERASWVEVGRTSSCTVELMPGDTEEDFASASMDASSAAELFIEGTGLDIVDQTSARRYLRGAIRVGYYFYCNRSI